MQLISSPDAMPLITRLHAIMLSSNIQSSVWLGNIIYSTLRVEKPPKKKRLISHFSFIPLQKEMQVYKGIEGVSSQCCIPEF